MAWVILYQVQHQDSITSGEDMGEGERVSERMVERVRSRPWCHGVSGSLAEGRND